MINYGYFRHRFDAHSNRKLNKLADQIGIEAFAYYYILLEIYGAEISQKQDKNSAEIHQRVLANAWRKRSDGVYALLSKMELSGLLVVSKTPLSDPLVTLKSQTTYQLSIPNFLKYYGSYSKTTSEKTPNKRKENKRKENNTKGELAEALAAPSQLKARATDIVAIYNQTLAAKFQPWKGTNPALEAKLAPCLEIMPDLTDWKRYFTSMGSHDFSWYAGKNLNIYLLLNPERVDQFLNGAFETQTLADLFRDALLAEH